MSGERKRRYLAHIAESIRLIEEYVRDGRQAFLEQRLVQDAVLRRLEVLADQPDSSAPNSKIGTEISRGERSMASAT